MTDTRANIEPEGCIHECRSTLMSDTRAWPGDVRRCEHGRIWIFTETVTGYFYNRLDLWRPVSRWWEPFRYRRAERALHPAPVSERTDTP